MLTHCRTPHPPPSRLGDIGLRALLVGLLIGLVAPSPLRACCDPAFVAETVWQSAPGAGLNWPFAIAADDLGNVHVVMRVENVPTLFTSRDGGLTFGAGDSTLIGDAWVSSIATTPDGRVIVAWGSAGSAFVRTSSDAGLSWTPAQRLFAMTELGTSASVLLQLVLDANGLAAVRANTARNGFSTKDITVAVSTDAGLTWSVPITEVSPLVGIPPGVRQVVARDGAVAFAWSDPTFAVQVRRSTDGGASWSPPAQASTTRLYMTADQFALTVTPDGSAQVVYFTDADTVRANASTDGGLTWPRPDELIGDRSGADDRTHALALSDGRVVALGWTDAGGGTISNFSSDRGLRGTWLGAPSRFGVMGDLPHQWRPVELPDGSVVVAHDDYRDDAAPPCPDPGRRLCESVYLARACPGETSWRLDDLRLDDDTPPNATHSEDPEITVTSSGRVHVVWWDADGPNVRHAAYDFFPLPTPAIDVVTTPAPDCTASYRLDLIDASTCLQPMTQWLRDGVPIPGATGPTHDVPPGELPGMYTYSVEVTCLGPGCVGTAPDVVLVPVVAPPTPETSETTVPATPCLPEHRVLEVVTSSVADCANRQTQWYRDGVAIPGETGDALEVSHRTAAEGTASYHYEVTCEPPRACNAASAPVVVTVPPDPRPRPASVGLALRGRDHGDPLAADITAVFDWSADPGLPRTGEHYHVHRGTDPTRLFLLTALEPFTPLSVVDSTPEARSWPHVHFYEVFAADGCEVVSAD